MIQTKVERRTRQRHDARDGVSTVKKILTRYENRIFVGALGAVIVGIAVAFGDCDPMLGLCAGYGGLLLGCSIGNMGL